MRGRQRSERSREDGGRDREPRNAGGFWVPGNAFSRKLEMSSPWLPRASDTDPFRPPPSRTVRKSVSLEAAECVVMLQQPQGMRAPWCPHSHAGGAPDAAIPGKVEAGALCVPGKWTKGRVTYKSSLLAAAYGYLLNILYPVYCDAEEKILLLLRCLQS